MNVTKEIINEHFKKPIKSYGRGRFIKNDKDFRYKESWQCKLYFLIFCIGNRKKCQTTRTFCILLGKGGEERGYLQITICMRKMF